jgi:glycosyltransferase involved in cell wall biosynthesis
MIISYCVPCHNRAHDLKKVMLSLITAANVSPPVEIMILDYNSPDDLAGYMKYMMEITEFTGGSRLSYKKYVGRDYFPVGHARNLSVLASIGEFLLISCADFILDREYFKIVREILEDKEIVWLCPRPHKIASVLGCSREEFIDAGGFDERFEYYGKEDKDMILRLKRRGKKFAYFPTGLVEAIYTPKEEKYKNIRPGRSRRWVETYSKSIYEENIENEVLVANKDGWGKWQE